MNTGKGKMEEVEAVLKRLLAGRVWSASLGRELESKRISLSDLLLDKQRKNVIKPADVTLIRQALGELQKNFQEEVKRVLLTEPELASDADRLAWLLLQLFAKKRKRVRDLTADQLALLQTEEAKKYVLFYGPRVYFRNNACFLTNTFPAELVHINDLAGLKGQPAAFSALLQGEEVDGEELKSWLDLFGPLYEEKYFGKHYGPGVELAGFQISSGKRDPRIYYVLRYLLKDKEPESEAEERSKNLAAIPLKTILRRNLVCHEAFK